MSSIHDLGWQGAASPMCLNKWPLETGMHIVNTFWEQTKRTNSSLGDPGIVYKDFDFFRPTFVYYVSLVQFLDTHAQGCIGHWNWPSWQKVNEFGTKPKTVEKSKKTLDRFCSCIHTVGDMLNQRIRGFQSGLVWFERKLQRDVRSTNWISRRLRKDRSVGLRLKDVGRIGAVANELCI